MKSDEELKEIAREIYKNDPFPYAKTQGYIDGYKKAYAEIQTTSTKGKNEKSI